eukprot:gnl/TRDRNA2_/TRDRNA2_29163_c0_seq1.p1 gnl/TRDRNA2_/TRDRNA2_29163_c0~~gnl/TRDRNA2_/TRDRNA2_29163_c0_seq1.p1  ORF type:complete len:315 (+),score=27.74 gnl/TRDRNA2_/TRDRNA2_29163_c0_seq1:186-1130(+)
MRLRRPQPARFRAMVLARYASTCLLLAHMTRSQRLSNSFARSTSSIGQIRARFPTSGVRPEPGAVHLRVGGQFEQRVSNQADGDVSLTSYMRLPTSQYVCLELPLGAKMQPVSGSRFLLKVPPIKFFNIEVMPVVYTTVLQNESAVVVHSNEVRLAGSPFVESLNGCYDIDARAELTWRDNPDDKAITCTTDLKFWVESPPPFKYFPNSLLKRTGEIAIKIALDQLDRAFSKGLGQDFEKWAISSAYRQQRAEASVCQAPEALLEAFDSKSAFIELTRIPASVLLALIVGSGVAYSVLRRCRRVDSAAEQSLLA